MAYYPDPNQPHPAHPGQQPRASHAQPAQGGYTRPWGSHPQHLSGNAPAPSLPSGSPGARAPSSPYPWTQPVHRPATHYRPLVRALCAFPFLSLKMFVWPGPATFAKEKDRMGWKAIWFLLLGGAAMTGVLAYLWGRVSRLTPGLENLSAGRVVPQPLSAGVCLGLAVGVPLLFLLLEGLLYQLAKKRGRKPSSVRAQLATGLLIEAPLFALLVAIALVLLYRPDLGSSTRPLFVEGASAFLLYSLLLHVFAVMAVHQVSAGKAMLCVALTVVILAAVVVVVTVVGENFDALSEWSSDARSGGGGGDLDVFGGDGGSGRRAHAKRYYLLCPTCGQQVPVALEQPSFPCPRCGTPMLYR